MNADFFTFAELTRTAQKIENVPNWEQIQNLQQLRNFLNFGFFDNGRFALWEASWKSFLQNPIFGVGFYHTCDGLGSGYAGLHCLSHNTVLQLLGSCGVVGMAAYAYHRYTTYRLFFAKFNHLAFFMGIWYYNGA